MSTLSIPVTQAQETFIKTMIKRGFAHNKAEVVRQALNRFAEDQAVEAVLRSQQEFRDGKELRGNIRELLKRV